MKWLKGIMRETSIRAAGDELACGCHSGRAAAFAAGPRASWIFMSHAVSDGSAEMSRRQDKLIAGTLLAIRLPKPVGTVASAVADVATR